MIFALLFVIGLFITPQSALIDMGEHSDYIRFSLPCGNYEYYDIAPGSLSDMVGALQKARQSGVKRIAFPYVFNAYYPELFNEVKAAYESGVNIYTSAGYVWTGPTDPAYLPFITTVGTLGPNGEYFSYVLYSDVEIIGLGCDKNECSNSLASARLGACD